MKIKEIGQKEGRERDKKLKDLLVRSFPLVKVKQLRPVIMSILKCTNHIEDKYLKVLVSSKFFLIFCFVSGQIRTVFYEQVLLVI